eukprot:TRINITY_DN1053_c0_g1_i12.p1 TRINITY_DN1053_c0_g1~~TRINITY_DN1053_c0_g1_i12.p1  ORF type:complete len:105 (-),score=12.26 TRINITY_DN1053_c0_g1_i12:108-422(-)
MGEKGLKGWKTRWFKCQGVELHYYKSEGKKDSQGFIDLKDVIRVQLHNDEVPFPDKKHAGCGFQIETEKSTAVSTEIESHGGISTPRWFSNSSSFFFPFFGHSK